MARRRNNEVALGGLSGGWYVRLAVIVLISAYAWCLVWPTMHQWVPVPSVVKKLFPRRISPGLDIQGGLRLAYEVEVDAAIRDRRDVLVDEIMRRFAEKMGYTKKGETPTREALSKTRQRVSITKEGDRKMTVHFAQAKDKSLLDRNTVTSLGDIKERGSTDTSMSLEISAERVQHLKDTAVQQAVKTISERIDELQVRETTVSGRGTDIIVEIPGADAKLFDRVRAIIGRTARLDFKVVADDVDFVGGLTDFPPGIEKQTEMVSAGASRPNQAVSYLTAKGSEGKAKLHAYIDSLSQSGRIQDEYRLALGRVDNEGASTQGANKQSEERAVWRTYYLYARSEVTGDYIDDAFVSFDPQDNKPVVALHFNGPGASLFEELTGRNIKRRMAIVLDDRVESAPVIQARIGGGRAQITLGGFADYQRLIQDANDLVVVLRAGALPAPIRPSNEQMIGPTLGQDSVKKGAMGAMLGIVLAIIFMLIYYEVGGLVADIMVVLNLLLLLATLAFFEATLTLPGIAGIALTVGMALDANVLILERMREELLLGKSPRVAVELGYQRAFSSIFDSQLTTLIAGVVLFQYGTGPIKGFAVTLMIGIITSLFTGVFCSKVMMDGLVRGLNIEKLRVG